MENSGASIKHFTNKAVDHTIAAAYARQLATKVADAKISEAFAHKSVVLSQQGEFWINLALWRARR